MNLQSFKLELIELLLSTDNIVVLNRLKELLEQGDVVNESEIVYHKKNKTILKPLTLKELNNKLDTSEREYLDGKFSTVDKLISKYS